MLQCRMFWSCSSPHLFSIITFIVAEWLPKISLLFLVPYFSRPRLCPCLLLSPTFPASFSHLFFTAQLPAFLLSIHSPPSGPFQPCSSTCYPDRPPSTALSLQRRKANSFIHCHRKLVFTQYISFINPH